MIAPKDLRILPPLQEGGPEGETDDGQSKKSKNPFSPDRYDPGKGVRPSPSFERKPPKPESDD